MPKLSITFITSKGELRHEQFHLRNATKKQIAVAIRDFYGEHKPKILRTDLV